MASLLERLRSPSGATGQATREQLLADYVAAEDALRDFTDRNFGRLCAICARWTLLATQRNAADRDRQEGGERSLDTLEWPLQSTVTNCCNANHAIESMTDESLAGIVASREAGRQWWETVKQSAGAPCAALTETGCALRRGRPELCNRYFCEAVRDYLWALGGRRYGSRLAARLDDLQKRWSMLYATYQAAIRGLPGTVGSGRSLHAVRDAAGWAPFLRTLDTFDRAIARWARPVTGEELSQRFFKVRGERSLYQPFFANEVAALGGHIRRPATRRAG